MISCLYRKSHRISKLVDDHVSSTTVNSSQYDPSLSKEGLFPFENKEKHKKNERLQINFLFDSIASFAICALGSYDERKGITSTEYELCQSFSFFIYRTWKFLSLCNNLRHFMTLKRPHKNQMNGLM